MCALLSLGGANGDRRTFILGEEGTMDPSRELKEESSKAGLAEDAFTTCGIGETLLY